MNDFHPLFALFGFLLSLFRRRLFVFWFFAFIVLLQRVGRQIVDGFLFRVICRFLFFRLRLRRWRLLFLFRFCFFGFFFRLFLSDGCIVKNIQRGRVVLPFNLRLGRSHFYGLYGNLGFILFLRQYYRHPLLGKSIKFFLLPRKLSAPNGSLVDFVRHESFSARPCILKLLFAVHSFRLKRLCLYFYQSRSLILGRFGGKVIRISIISLRLGCPFVIVRLGRLDVFDFYYIILKSFGSKKFIIAL